MGADAGARSFVSESAEATEALGGAFAELLRAGDVVALHGELGAGKTCFVRGLAHGLGVRTPVASPSFTLMHTYAGRLSVYHLDAWMTERGEAFLEDGGAEWLTADGVAAVEWAERVAAWLPQRRFEVRLAHLDAQRRALDVRWLGEGDEPGRLASLRVPGGIGERAPGLSEPDA